MVISQRVLLSIILCIGTINICSQRMNLNIAILCMLNETALSNMEISVQLNKTDPVNITTCTDESFEGAQDMIDGPFIWDRQTTGILLGMLFWGYFAGQIPAGILMRKFTVRSIVLILLIVLSFSTILVPPLAMKSIYYMYFLRILTGLATSAWLPGFYQLWTVWAPPNERGLLIGFALAGLHIGNAISLPISGIICQTFGWQLVFYCCGAVSFIYCFIWFLLVHDDPQAHPYIEPKEKAYLTKNCPKELLNSLAKPKFPLCDILKSPPVWAFFATNVSLDWNICVYMISAPTYMKEVLRFDLQSNSFLSALPHVGLWMGQVFSGWLSDFLLANGVLSLKTVRKLMNSVGMFGPALIMSSITFFDCRRKYIVVALLTVGLILLGAVFSGSLLNPVEIASCHAGLLFAGSNSISALTGVFAPVVVNTITSDRSYDQWRYVFFLGSVILLAGGLLFLMFSAHDIQPWAQTEGTKRNEYWPGERKISQVYEAGPDYHKRLICET